MGKEKGERLYNRTEINNPSTKIMEDRFMEKLFTERAVRCSNRLPRAVDAPSLEVFKAGLYGTLCSLIYYSI